MEPEGSLPHSQVPATCPYLWGRNEVSAQVRDLLYEHLVLRQTFHG